MSAGTNSGMPHGTVTFLFTDIVGSTELWNRDSDQMSGAVADHDADVKRIIADHDGHIFGVGGDGFCAAFAAVGSSIEAAVEIAANFASDGIIEVRQGIHTGEADQREGAYFGLEVNKTARIASCADAGQILLSDVTVALLPTTGDSVKLTELGRFHMRGISDQVGISQLGTEVFGPLRGVTSLLGNIAAMPNRFVGRQREVAAVDALVRDSRITTLTGPGGVGKTRLATHCAGDMAADFPGGAWFAALAPLSGSDVVAQSIADAIGLSVDSSAGPTDSVVRWFRSNEVLLVVDNCEHVLDEAARVLGQISAASTSSRMLVTSQVPLGIAGESVIAIGPLSDGTGADSAALFVDRARAVRSDFEMTPDNESAIAQICERLDHIPLAVELAASRMRSMGAHDVARHLDERFRLLRSNDRLAPERHQTLDAAVRWSFDLLEPSPQAVLRRLAVFAAPFTVEQAGVVAGSVDLDSWEVFDIVMELVDRSLVVMVDHGGASRYHLLESIKAFGRNELEASGDAPGTTERFETFFYDMAIEQGAAFLGPGDVAAFEIVDSEWQNIRVAIDAFAADIASPRFEEVFSAFAPLWNARGRALEGGRWADVLASRPVIETASRARALIPAAGVANVRRSGDGQRFIDEAETLWKTADTEAPIGALANRALQAMMAGEDERAIELCREVIALSSDVPRDSWNREHAVTNVLSVLSVIDEHLEVFLPFFTAEKEAAQQHSSAWHRVTLRSTMANAAGRMDLDDPVSMVRGIADDLVLAGNLQTASHTLGALTVLEMRRGDFAAAAAAQSEAVQLAVGNASGYMGLRVGLAAGVLMFAAPTVAAQAIGFVRQFRIDRGLAGASRELAGESVFESVVRDALGDEFDALEERGRMSDHDELVAMVVAELDQLSTPRVE